MPPEAVGAVRAGTAVLAAALVLLASGCGTSRPDPLYTNTVAPRISNGSTTTTVPPADASTSVPASVVTVAGATAQAADGSLLLTLDGHVAGLAADLAGARLDGPLHFTMTLEGIHLGSPLSATFPGGQVASVTTATTPAGTQVSARLRTPATAQSVAVGAGNEVDISFS